jgi:hypothetical protein
LPVLTLRKYICVFGIGIKKIYVFLFACIFGLDNKFIKFIKNLAQKLRIIGRLNYLLVSQPFLYICVGQYTIVMVEITTQEYGYNIFYIVYI